MRKAVAAADVDLAKEGCAPNLTLIVTDDGQALIAGLAKAHPKLFGLLSALEMDSLRKSPGPAWSWHVTQPKRADGAPVVRDGAGSPSAFVVQGAKLSRLGSPIRQEVDAGFVVLDVESIDGLTLKQIGDFAVMRALVPTRDAQNERFGYDSILNLFKDDDTPEGLTPFDREYLAAVYRGGNGFTYNQKTKQIAQDVERGEQSADLGDDTNGTP
ncbi:hypothetical protein [Qipengyuania qiaonensis]|uniref:Uncharacterized protein n=1 Tax=Qipengyuania qiaonensis TaxID=2867240 RepID=A0ABS7J8Q3_9SPHN|nr:hypothetical protein [Qipengyuania qiaonensis]MBX7483700.1 hypothetical protein [Qipengyuania qiaonensis]